MKIFGIHGGGNIGLGLMADVINHSKLLEPYQIIATSNDIFFNALINGNNQLRLQHIGADEGDDTVVSHVRMTQRNHSDIVKLYTDATEIIAMCLTQSSFEESAESIAQGIINRYEQSKSKLAILVLMNRQYCDEYVRETTYHSNQVISQSLNFFATKGNMLTQSLKNIGIRVDAHSGNIFYTSSFQPLQIDFELVFVRHGETFGNAGLITSEGFIDDKVKKNHENRIFQGNIDGPINQLTLLGEQQAINAAVKLENELLAQGWIPDIILHSPLQRAKATGLPFVKRNGFEEKYFELASITEMSFGSLENRRVCDIPAENQAHSFYKKQNALVKCPGEDVHGLWRDAENFCQVLLRARHTLQALNEQFKDKKIVMFSHSMFGAACCIIMGQGNLIEHGDYLAFDGARSDGTSYTMPNATPFLLNVNINGVLAKRG